MQTNSEGPLAYIADFSLCSSWPCLPGQSWDSNPRSRTALRGSTRHPSEPPVCCISSPEPSDCPRSEEHTSELQSRFDLVCRLLLEKKKKKKKKIKYSLFNEYNQH